MSLEDKVTMGTGVGLLGGNCIGNIPAVKSIGFPGLCLEDSPLGVRATDGVSAFPAGINTAATFNRTLMRERGAAMAAEFRGKGVHVALGPMMNIVRSPAAGRNWEGFGGDPYLSGEGAYETITGVQSVGVQACAKHFINNEQEHFRETSSSNVDDRAVRSSSHPYDAFFTASFFSNTRSISPLCVYLSDFSSFCNTESMQFLRSVQANVASVMCSYNQVNGSYACENDKTLNGILKGELGFQGYVMSDWYATHSTQSVNKGLDMTMPGETAALSWTGYFGSALVDAVKSGNVSTERIDDLATRILAGWYLLGQDSSDYPAVSFNWWDFLDPVNKHVNVQGDHANLIRTIGAASTVLLKNLRGTLPLKAPKTIAVVGNGAGSYFFGPNLLGKRHEQLPILDRGKFIPLDAIKARAKTDNTAVSDSTSDSDLGAAGNVASGKQVALVFITADSGEAYLTVEGNAGDRNDLFAWHNGDALVEKVASVNNNTVVVVNTVGAIDMEAWINNPNVTAVVWSGLPGQEADVLYGDYNPSGRLPYTIGKSIDDYSSKVIYSGSNIVQIPYTEGLMVDYRHFDAAGIEPRFEFGYGLSYTTFDYTGLSISGSVGSGASPSGPGSSLDPWLHEPVITVTFTLRNNGSVAGHEVPQLYTSPPASAASAPFNLKGFDNVYLEPGQSKTVSFDISRYDLSTWSVVNQRWEIAHGVTGISVGASSRDLRLKKTINV
ncbi:glycoside hydrolase family 3 protein [Amylostereum chailletii]|nr:glycoside hydrolase family 3 protein [Amylostereum chailletii]